VCSKERTIHVSPNVRDLPNISTPLTPNKRYFGDNLHVMRTHIADASVDLIYLDPPFKSNQDYNILFVEQDGTRSAAQIKAFEDTWRWD
jgi:site-specific DNA-methyltransferase (adenine-specific)